MNGFDFSGLMDIFARVIPALICITLHELGHGLCALALGDDTAKRAGRLTLNPVRHIDPAGLVMIIVFRFGWAKPVPVDMRNFRKPKLGMAVTAAAGPLTNLLIAAVFFFLYGLLLMPLLNTSWGNFFLELFYLTAYLSIILAVFNLIPIPPLDGSRILFSLASDRIYYSVMRYERYLSLALMALVMLGSFTGYLNRAASALTDVFLNFARAGLKVYEIINL